jgi:hypothetical protein
MKKKLIKISDLIFRESDHNVFYKNVEAQKNEIDKKCKDIVWNANNAIPSYAQSMPIYEKCKDVNFMFQNADAEGVEKLIENSGQSAMNLILSTVRDIFNDKNRQTEQTLLTCTKLMDCCIFPMDEIINEKTLFDITDNFSDKFTEHYIHIMRAYFKSEFSILRKWVTTKIQNKIANDLKYLGSDEKIKKTRYAILLFYIIIVLNGNIDFIDNGLSNIHTINILP